MTPLGGVHELDFAAETLESNWRVPSYRLAQLLRGAADSCAVYEADLGEPPSFDHLHPIADRIEAGGRYNAMDVARLLRAAARQLRHYEARKAQKGKEDA